jgi:hypothetical protein
MWNRNHSVNSQWRLASPWQVAKLVALAFAWILILSVASQSWGQVANEGEAVVADMHPPLPQQQFDQLVFGFQRWVSVSDGVRKLVSPANPTVKDFRHHVDELVATEIQAINQKVSLTDSQTKKLQLAARGDITDYIRRVEDLRPQLTSKRLDEQEYQKLWGEMRLLRMGHEIGFLGEKSLFQKTLRAMLTDEQRLGLESLKRERQAAVIEAAMQKLEVTSDGLTLAEESRRKFADVVLEHGHMPQNVGSYGRSVLILEANVLRDRIKSILTEAEWTEFETQVGMAKRVEQFLETYGIWTARRTQTGGQETDDETKD